jgi:hypothetical protein
VAQTYEKSMSRAVAMILGALILWLAPLQATDDPYVGYFVGDLDGRRYRVTIERVNSSTYDGILLVDDERMQLDARRYGELLNGLLRSPSEQFGFRARIEGGILIVDTEDGRRIILRRGTAPQ